MKSLPMSIASFALLAALMLALSASAAAQTKLPPDPGPSVARPADSGMVRKPGTVPMEKPSESGMVVVPPKVDSEAVKQPPTKGEAKIKDATGAIDRKNLEKSEEKQKAQ